MHDAKFAGQACAKGVAGTARRFVKSEGGRLVKSLTMATGGLHFTLLRSGRVGR